LKTQRFVLLFFLVQQLTMASPMCLKICGAISCGHSLLFFIFALWCFSEMGRFNPFYTPVACENPLLHLPLHEYITATGGLDVQSYTVNSRCSNPNQLDMTIGTKSTGDVLVLNPDGKTFTTVGKVTTPTAATFKINCKNTPFQLNMQMALPGAVVTGIVTALTAQATAQVLIPAVPLFFSLLADSKIESNFMFMANSDTMVLPKKYCGTMATILSTPAPGALKSVTQTMCRNTAAEAIAAVTNPKMPRTLGMYHQPADFIDNLDPLKTYLDEQEGAAKMGAMMFMAIFVITSSSTGVGAYVCYKKVKAAKAAAGAAPAAEAPASA